MPEKEGNELTGVTCTPPSNGTSIRQRSNGSGSGGVSTATPSVKLGSTAGSGVTLSIQEKGPVVAESTAI